MILTPMRVSIESEPVMVEYCSHDIGPFQYIRSRGSGEVYIMTDVLLCAMRMGEYFLDIDAMDMIY